MKPYITTPEHAVEIADWLQNRGGIAIWMSIDFSRLGQSLTTPVNMSTGERAPKPAWWVASTPERIITDPAEVVISRDVEVKRFRVAVRMGAQGLMLKCSDGASRRIRHEVSKAGEGAYHTFDYAAQEAVIFKPESQVPLLDWLALPHA